MGENVTDSQANGCALVMFFIIPVGAGIGIFTGLNYGPWFGVGAGLLSVPVVTLLSSFILAWLDD